MKSVQTTLGELTRKIEAHWHTWLRVELDANHDASHDTPPTGEPAAVFPLTLPLGRLDAAALASSFRDVNRDALEWQAFADKQGVEVRWENRLVHGSTQRIATHLVITDATQAAALAGQEWPQRLRTARQRQARLTEEFGTVSASLVRAISGLSDVDFELLCTTARWLRANDPAGLTARQVPVEGVHGKWLNTRRRELLALSGRDSLGLVERASQVRYAYLDPQHLAAGGRRYDSHTIGDTSRPLYPPRVAVISENKDTALLFGELPGAISIFGNGYAAVGQLPAVPWLRDIQLLVYWGDIDADGYEIVDGLRAAGLDVHTILMDLDSYKRYERYGSPTDTAGRPLRAAAAKPLVHLSEAERTVYELFVDPAWSGTRRIEQERIPLTAAADAVQDLLEAQDLQASAAPSVGS